MPLYSSFPSSSSSSFSYSSASSQSHEMDGITIAGFDMATLETNEDPIAVSLYHRSFQKWLRAFSERWWRKAEEICQYTITNGDWTRSWSPESNTFESIPSGQAEVVASPCYDRPAYLKSPPVSSLPMPKVRSEGKLAGQLTSSPSQLRHSDAALPPVTSNEKLLAAKGASLSGAGQKYVCPAKRLRVSASTTQSWRRNY